MKLTTLSEFVVERQADFPYAQGELSRLLSAIRLAAKIVNREVNKAGIASHIIGAVGSENVQGEQQQKLDVYANDQFIAALKAQGIICGLASEELENFTVFKDELSEQGKYVIAIDPLDGSSNIDVNVSIGTIFSIYRRKSMEGPVKLEDFLQKGTEIVAAGYVIYGSSTMLVYSTGNGVNGFTFDSSLGVFFLSHENMQIPADGAIYSVNEANYFNFDQGTRNYIDYCKKSGDYKPTYSARYIGSLVADFHRNLIKGGIYMYPATTNAPNGKLRLLYECAPLAFLIEQAGGLATTGNGTRILDIEPTELHQRVPYFVGSKNMVQKAEEFIQENQTIHS